MSEWAQPGLAEAASAPVAASDGEPRAGEVIRAAAGGRVLGYDPALRWEQALPAQSPPPTLVKPEMPRSARAPRLDPDALLRMDLTRTEYQISPEVASALLENTPQWFLRDLDRPREQSPAMYEIREEDRVLGIWDAALREAERARVRLERPRVITAIELIVEDQRRRTRFYSEPWEPLMPDDAPRRAVLLSGPFEGFSSE